MLDEAPGGADGSRVALLPAGMRTWLADAIAAGGGRCVPVAEAEALIWAEPDGASGLEAVLAANPRLRWVQLPWAGIEPYAGVVAAHPELVWTCGKGVYAGPVAELALTLLLAGLRGLSHFNRALTWTSPAGANLGGASVVVLGGGGITESFLQLLAPFGTRATVVRRHPVSMAGAAAVVGADELDAVLAGADALVVALSLTPETTGIVDRRRLALLAPHAWVVNVARGRHVVTDDLVAALAEGSIGGAGLDVTDPEPLPDGHPLWGLANCIITPHVGNTPEMATPLLSRRVSENVRRWAAGVPLLGPVDPALGY